jgi:redox-sensitive bicupin YhaK (pirin superfamily)
VNEAIEVWQARETPMANHRVHRALPRRARRSIGSWCFVDHLGPEPKGKRDPLIIAPHPHVGLSTVTWLLKGEIVHRDSLGSEQLIRAHQRSLMTAGFGISHSEEAPKDSKRLHGVQLWLAQPRDNRTPTFVFDDKEQREIRGDVDTVLIAREQGCFAEEISLGTQAVEIALNPGYEHGMIVLQGGVSFEGVQANTDEMAYIPPGHDSIRCTASRRTKVILLGGEPLSQPIVMWWNFVGSNHQEISRAVSDWNIESASRFGRVKSEYPQIPAPLPPWMRSVQAPY